MELGVGAPHARALVARLRDFPTPIQYLTMAGDLRSQLKPHSSGTTRTYGIGRSLKG